MYIYSILQIKCGVEHGQKARPALSYSQTPNLSFFLIKYQAKIELKGIWIRPKLWALIMSIKIIRS